MPTIQRFDHVGITVADLDHVSTFFLALGLQVQAGPMDVEGDFLDTVIGIPGSHTRIVVLRAPHGGTLLELSSSTRPEHQIGSPTAMATEPGLRNVAFEVDDLDALLQRLAADGYGLVGGVGEHQHTWRMAYVRRPEGITISLAERLG
ncbi:VOC family protein [Kineococcus sp. SYSU DK005]|uniref:VOC family protein n=1 Tax=Kineococcus sp. SYSU DK005 TaxID=3383126 RepID=UPI003D7C48F0